VGHLAAAAAEHAGHILYPLGVVEFGGESIKRVHYGPLAPLSWREAAGETAHISNRDKTGEGAKAQGAEQIKEGQHPADVESNRLEKQGLG